MKTSIAIGGADSGKRGHFERIVSYAVEAERLGIDGVWSAEAWGMDAIAPLAYVAARTQRVTLGTGIAQIQARTPVMTAMTALTMASISGDRFILGLGVSGPQVVEGLHGVAFAHPVGRLRETIEIIKLAISGEKIVYEGKHFRLPRPGGEGKPLRMAQPPNPNIPIYIASLGTKGLELLGEVADGWCGTSFTPEGASFYTDAIARGAHRAGRDPSSIEISAPAQIAFGDDLDELIARRRPGLAFQLGAMGSPKTNFYNDAFRKMGFDEAARHVQQLWNDGRREEATSAVPDEMVMATSLLGTESMIGDRMRAYRDAGVTNLHLHPLAATLDERLDIIGRAVDLVRDMNAR